jgi:hypothetical protein
MATLSSIDFADAAAVDPKIRSNVVLPVTPTNHPFDNGFLRIIEWHGGSLRAGLWHLNIATLPPG